MTKIQEVQWSSFGSRGGFGSFSDFLSVFPADSAEQEDVNARSSDPDADFFRISEQSTSSVGSNLPAEQHDEVAFLDLQPSHSEGPSSTAPESEASEQLKSQEQPTGDPQVLTQVKSEGKPAYLQSHGLEQEVQSELSDPIQPQDFQLHDQEQQIQGDYLNHIRWQALQSQAQVQQAQRDQFVHNQWHNLQSQSQEQRIGSRHLDSSHWDTLQTLGQTQQAQSDHVDHNQLNTLQAQGQKQQAQSDHVDHNQLNTLQSQGQEQGQHAQFGKPNQGHWQELAEYPGWLYNVNTGLWVEKSSLDGGDIRSSWNYPGQYQNLDTLGATHSSQWQGLARTENSSLQVEDSGLTETQLGRSAAQIDIHGDSNLTGPTNITHNLLFQNNSGQQNSSPWQESIGAPGGYRLQSRLEEQYSSWYYDYQAQEWKEKNIRSSSCAVVSLSHTSEEQPPSPLLHQQAKFVQETGDANYDAQRRYSPLSFSAFNSCQTQQNGHYTLQTPPKALEAALRTSVGRPLHILTSFGFGGKLLVMKFQDPFNLQASDGSQSVPRGQGGVTGPVHVHSLDHLVSQTAGSGREGIGSLYFGSLCGWAFSGPLVGGNFSLKDVSKWLEERATCCQAEDPYSRNPGSLSILWGLLKLLCQQYGKLRSAAGTSGIILQEVDGPEEALSRLLTSGVDQSSWTMRSLSSAVCLQPVPSEHHLQMTASGITKLLVTGKCKEALKQAQQGQLWGLALVLARQLGEKYYTDTVAEMAQRQFLPGSPLRTLSLLLAGQPAEVFSGNNVPTAMANQPMHGSSALARSNEDGLGSMLEEWPENLSIMAANRTSGDDSVISLLGDCLWKVKGEVTAAHICYLVADGSLWSFSSAARLCLIGADHLKNPRTYATPKAIQRTEVYEYSKVLGNPQFILVPFLPYKLIYASMLAEAGKPTEALRYCQAVVKTLKIAGCVPEVETCRQAATSLEERLRIHIQSGHSINLAPGKLVRGFLRTLDRSIHGFIGGPPPSPVLEHEKMRAAGELATLQDHLAVGRVGDSLSRSPAPLVPSASAEKLKEAGRPVPQRSASEPDFSTSKKGKAEQQKPAKGGGYLGRFGSVFSKAGGIVSMVAKPNKNEAKLGDTNKFYYDETLKRWIEEGAEATVKELALPPPPTSFASACMVEDSSPDVQFRSGDGTSSGTRTLGTPPPVPPSNQFSTRARHQGVRSRYVDTFNKGEKVSSSNFKPAASSFAQDRKVGGRPQKPMNFFVPGSSLVNLNGSISDSENGTTLESSQENHVDESSGTALNLEDRLGKTQHLAVQNLFHQSGMSGSTINRVPSSENTMAFGLGGMHRVPSSKDTSTVGCGESVQADVQLEQNPSNGDRGFNNNHHLRANSWSGYPSTLRASQKETKSSYVTNYNMCNIISSQSTANTSPSAGSYFLSPVKVDAYEPNPGSGVIEHILLPQASAASSMGSTMLGELIPGALEARGNKNGVGVLVADELQEVEL